MKRFAVLVAVLLAVLSAGARASADPVDMVNPFIGTTYGGDTFPGPDYPFGMIQWSPDTTSQPAGGGYEYGDVAITGFSLTHLSGPGCPVMNDAGILPYTGATSDPAAASMPFTHVQEHASPGYYEVLLGENMDLDVRMTSTLRTALAAFRFPGKTPQHVLFNLAHSGMTVLAANIAFHGNRTFDGFVKSGGFCGMPGSYTVYFAGEFDVPFRAGGAWHGKTVAAGQTSASGADAGAWVDFDSSVRTVKMRVAVSFVDEAGARKNLAAEGTSWSIDAVRARAQAAWRAALGHARIAGGTDAQQHDFWTALYHAMLHPNVISDVDGRYPGFDGKIHTAPHGHREYGNWSGWDVYRTQLQLLGFMLPRETSDMVRSLLDANDQMGLLPRWALVNDESSVMNGDPGPSLIADAYFFGARGFDTHKALQAMIHGASALPNPPAQGWYQERNDLAEYLRLGYVDSHRQNSVSHVPNGASETLEYAISDYAIAAFARNLGDTDAYRTFLRRSGNWANLLDAANGYIEPRNERGQFVVAPSTDEGQLGFQEGNAAQYTWVVPQDQSGLIRALGRGRALRELDAFFSVLPEHDGDWGTPYIGLNNEPSFGAPFLYLSAHEPAQTQRIVRLIETKYFDNAPGGEPGNDDLGAMSAMYVWEAAGLYPQTPGTATLDLASPLFTHVELRSEDGRRIVVDAPQARTDAPYVRALRVNGRLTQHTWVTVPARGNVTLRFDVGTSPSHWGSGRGDEPPSFDAGVRPPPATTAAVAGNATATAGMTASQLESAPLVVTYFDGSVIPFEPRTHALGKWFTLHERVPDALRIPGTTRVALASIYTNSVVFADIASARIAGRVKTEANPNAFALIGSMLWTADRGAASVQPIDVTTMKAGEGVLVGASPVALLASAGGKTLYAADQGANAVSVIDLAQRKEVARIPTGAAPAALALAPDGTLWVADSFGNDLTIVDPQTRTPLAHIAVGVFPRAIAFADGKAYVANWADSTITVLDTRSRKVVQTLHCGDQPAALAASADGSKIYIALSGDNAFQAIDTRTGRLSPWVYTPGSSPRVLRR